MRPAQAIINVTALRHNLRRAQMAAPHSKTIAVVKANAYGHGLLNVLPALAQADAFAVACIEEALAIRQAQNHKPIVLLSGFIDREELALCVEHRVCCVLHDQSQLDLLHHYPPEHTLSVWLKIDTGMHRLGFRPEQTQQILAQLRTIPTIQATIGLMTHFACADELTAPSMLQQLDIWQNLTRAFQGPTSAANSAAVLAWPDSHGDWIRPGIMLYGISPFGHHIGAEYDLSPVMSLHTKLIAIKHLKRGDAVGYGATWLAHKPLRLGIAAIGYGDGYPRHAPSGTPVLVAGQTARLAGRVSMDMLTLDLSDAPAARVGSDVVLWGPSLPIEHLAERCSTIGYELVCEVTPRVHTVLSH